MIVIKTNKEMKKILLTLITLTLTATSCLAQNEAGTWTLTPKAGLNFARLTDPDIYIDMGDEKIEYTYKPALTAGIEAEYQLNSRVGLAAELLYSNQGCIVKDNSAFRNGKNTLHYLNLPLTAKFYFAPNLAFRVGLQPGFALGRHIEEDENDGNGQWTHHSSSDTWFRRFDLSLPLGLSYNIGAFEVDARYNLGLNNITDVDAVKIHNRVLQITIGYRFAMN